jgi:septation ring formation regulator EzrA
MNKDILVETLKEISDRLQTLEAQGRDVRGIVVEISQGLSDLRAGVLDNANRMGEQVKKHEGEIIRINARLASLDRAARLPRSASG